MKNRPREARHDPSSLTICGDDKEQEQEQEQEQEAQAPTGAVAARRIWSSFGSPTNASLSHISLTATVLFARPGPQDAGAASQYMCHTRPNVPWPSTRSADRDSLGGAVSGSTMALGNVGAQGSTVGELDDSFPFLCPFFCEVICFCEKLEHSRQLDRERRVMFVPRARYTVPGTDEGSGTWFYK